MEGRTLSLYRSLVLKRPWLTAAAILAVVGLFASALPDFKLDVSSEGLILEKDPALRVYDASRLVFGSDDYVIVAFRSDDVFSDENVRIISDLTRDLSAIEGVDRVMSITSEQLFLSPPLEGGLLALMMGGGEPLTLDSEKCDRALARKELTESGIWANNIVSPDGTRTSLLVYLLQRSEAHALEKRIHWIDRLLRGGEEESGARKDLEKEIRALEESAGGGGPEAERAKRQGEESARLLAKNKSGLRAWRRETSKVFQAIVDERRDRRAMVLESIREVLNRHDFTGTRFFSSGLPLIFVDMMAYVRRDMMLFGALVGCFLVLVLGIVFRQARWIVLPMAAGICTTVIVVGAMVAADIRTTVITSNLTSLLMILTMAHSIHFAVRYDEEHALAPDSTRKERILRAVGHIGLPCFFIAMTTAVGFLSLIISGIRPVIEFGQFMALGVLLAFAVTFLIVPAGLALWPLRRKTVLPPPSEKGFFQPLARLTARFRWAFLALSLVLTAFSIAGIARLDVETIFIDYFKKDTEIYRGLRFIDQEMGGTTSLEVILTSEEENYFTTWEHLEPIRKIETYLNGLPEVGKVLSPLTLMNEIDRVLVAYGLPHPPGEDRHAASTLLYPLDRMGTTEMGPGRAPLYSYLDPTGRIARVFVRIKETTPGLERRFLVNELKAFLDREAKVPGLRVEVTGIFVLYANMLHSLFDGATKSTLGVFVAILLMMVVLFRSVRLGFLAIVPNVIPILFVLGTMGWLGVNLDMNNIMVASVTMGIAVDDTLHYLFRYRREIQRDGDYEKAMERTHNTVGKAIVLTSVVIVSGFLVLAFSNFIPTQNFGVFSSLAMVAALLAAMTLLPACILVFKPFGKEPHVLTRRPDQLK